MKVKDEKGVIHNAKLVDDPENEEFIELQINGETYCSHHFLMENLEIVDIDRSELKLYHKFMNDARFVLMETSEYFEGKMEAWHEAHEEREKGGED